MYVLFHCLYFHISRKKHSTWVRKFKKTPSFSFWDKNPGRFFQLGQIPEKVPQSVSSTKLCFSPPLEKTPRQSSEEMVSQR